MRRGGAAVGLVFNTARPSPYEFALAAPVTTRWTLAVDFGTTFTVAAGLDDTGPAEVIEVAGERRVPSVVLVEPDGSIVAGRIAEELSGTRPDSVLRTPKSRLGDPSPIVLNGRPRSIVDLVAALLKVVLDEGTRQFGVEPAEVRLTHPALWGKSRLAQLVESGAAAGMRNIMLVPEPVAAALAYWRRGDLAPGSYVVIYDLGGGTFDTAVLESTDDGFRIVGRPGGDLNVGGELFDELLANAVGEQLDPAVWEGIQLASDRGWRQVAAVLRSEARRAKETMSSYANASLLLPLQDGLSSRVVTREMLESLVAPYLDDTVDALGRSVTDAGLQPADLAAIQLAGGASRMPIVERLVREGFPGVPVHRRGDPKTAVALGALIAPTNSPTPPRRRPEPPSPIVETVPVAAPLDPPNSGSKPGTSAATPTVSAVFCSRGHPNSPDASSCRVCRASVRGTNAVTIPRPLLGTLVFAGGQRVPIDRPIRIGRLPTFEGALVGEVPRLVKLTSSERGISRNHADIQLKGWDVVLTDLKSSNGTVVTVPGGSAVRLRPDEPVTISPGTSVHLGDETSFVFEAAP